VHRVACDTVLLHHGVVPNVQASRALGLAHDWSAPQQCFVPRCDAWGRSLLDRVFVAGDGAGIGGAGAAALAGRLAALEIATDLGALLPGDRDLAARPLWRRLSQERAIRPFLDRAYPPSAEALDPADDTLVCRCEEVRAGDIRAAARQGCLGPNQAKSFTRAGMGPCQGRYCGLSVTGLLSKAHGQSPQQTGYYRIRPPLKPVTLGELAGLAQPQDSKD
jgi:NADPH-dependent 2,4-dienoyl-CoA reductase/sulfur reductase-like enzyme